MKVAEFLKKSESLPKEQAEFLNDVVSIWSNDACMGYCIRAMQIAGFDEEHIRSAMRGMHRAFDELTEEEAGEVYLKW